MASERKYCILGFDNGEALDVTITAYELMNTKYSDNDTELLYTLIELYLDDILDLRMGQNMVAKSTRDSNEFNNIIIHRIS